MQQTCIKTLAAQSRLTTLPLDPLLAAIEMRSNPHAESAALQKLVVFSGQRVMQGTTGVKPQKACATINERNQSW
jgi:hypothetical protein